MNNWQNNQNQFQGSFSNIGNSNQINNQNYGYPQQQYSGQIQQQQQIQQPFEHFNQQMQMANNQFQQQQSYMNYQMQQASQTMNSQLQQASQTMNQQFQQAQQQINQSIQAPFMNMNMYGQNSFPQGQQQDRFQDGRQFQHAHGNYKNNFNRNQGDGFRNHKKNNKNQNISQVSSSSSSSKGSYYSNKSQIVETPVILLELFEGDQEKVNQCLESSEKLAITIRNNKKPNQKQLLKKKYSSQLQFLKQNGFACSTRSISVLIQENGNQEITLRLLVRSLLEKEFEILKNSNKQKRMMTSSKISEEVQKKITESMKQLALEGWVINKTYQRISSVLQMYEGNLERSREEVEMKCFKIIKRLTLKEEQRLQNVVFDDCFSEQVTQMVLDGNNVLFINRNIRNDSLNKRRDLAEKKICQIAQNFTEIMQLNKFIVVFDQMKSNNNFLSGKQFEVINTETTEFSSADDLIFSIVSKLDPNQAKNFMVITSDQELTSRLSQEKSSCHFMKGKVFFEKIEELLSRDFIDSITQSQS